MALDNEVSPTQERPENVLTMNNTKPTFQHQTANLDDVERSNGKAAFILNFTEVKLLAIAGVGFFLDAYDLFIINPVTTMLQYRLYGGKSLPANLEGFVKAGANIGSVIGQFTFGYAADALGRKTVYGKELILIIVATIFTISAPTGQLSPEGSLIYIGIFRILLGVGVGGDYPMSASVVSDRASLRKRGSMLAYIFSMQGWGSFVGSLMTIIVLACYKKVIDVDGETSKVDGVWRIIVGFSLIPAFSTLYSRFTLPESIRYIESQRINFYPESTNDDLTALQGVELKERATIVKEKNNVAGENGLHDANKNDGDNSVPISTRGTSEDDEASLPPEVLAKKHAHFKDFYAHFKQWRNAKLLIGTCACWFLLDVAFYGINLNQNVVLQQIGIDGSSGSPWERLFKISTGNLIITALGFVPGYYATVLTIELLGRKWIQMQGFLLTGLFLAIIASLFDKLTKAQFVVCFAFLQFFFNFGANSTTYCYPAELFPTRYRASAHGISAACGKAGAIISALAFNTLSKKVGTPIVMWIFFGCSMFGAVFTLLLPEVKGRDPDVILAKEIADARKAMTTGLDKH